MQNPNSRHGGIIAGLLFAGIAVFLALSVASVIVFRLFTSAAPTVERDTHVAIDTPAGRVNIRAGDHMDATFDGVPIYPGSYSAKDGGVNFLDAIGGEFRTQDSVSKVVEFYRRQLPRLTIASRHKEFARLEYEDGAMQRIISIDEHGRETHIKLPPSETVRQTKVVPVL